MIFNKAWQVQDVDQTMNCQRTPHTLSSSVFCEYFAKKWPYFKEVQLYLYTISNDEVVSHCPLSAMHQHWAQWLPVWDRICQFVVIDPHRSSVARDCITGRLRGVDHGTHFTAKFLPLYQIPEKLHLPPILMSLLLNLSHDNCVVVTPKICVDLSPQCHTSPLSPVAETVSASLWSLILIDQVWQEIASWEDYVGWIMASILEDYVGWTMVPISLLSLYLYIKFQKNFI